MKFTPYQSQKIFTFYWFLILLIAGIFTLVLTKVPFDAPWEFPLIAAIMAFSLSLIAYSLYRGYKMHYTIQGNTLKIHGIFKTYIIPLSSITSVQSMPLPFGFRLFGASGLGGIYYFPSIGITRVAIGSLKEGVLIKTRDEKRYFVSPKDHTAFIQALPQ